MTESALFFKSGVKNCWHVQGLNPIPLKPPIQLLDFGIWEHVSVKTAFGKT